MARDVDSLLQFPLIKKVFVAKARLRIHGEIDYLMSIFRCCCCCLLYTSDAADE